MEASPLIRATLSTPLQEAASSVVAQSAFATPVDPQPPSLGELLTFPWSPYGALVRPPLQPQHNLAAGAMLFDAFA